MHQNDFQTQSATTTASTNGSHTKDHGDLESIQDVIVGASKFHAVPLWPQMVKYNPPRPNPKCVPFIWRYEEVRPYLVRAGDLVKEREAERRLLMLVNPKRGELIHTDVELWRLWLGGMDMLSSKH